ncbi:MAG: SpoIIE family protein phosphatase [Planctomycetota bacterium]
MSALHPQPRATPYLAVIINGGPQATHELDAAVTTIGRSVDNVLEVPDPNMSRRHCVIEQREDGAVVLTDCNSSNGTKVNGRRIVSRELKDHDEIECGSTLMIFAMNVASLPSQPLTPTPPRGLPPTSRLDDGELEALNSTSSGPLRTLRKQEALVLAHERDDLKRLLEINKQLNEVHDLRSLLKRIIDSAIALLAAERGFLILNDAEEQDRVRLKIEIARNRARRSIPNPEAQVSTQVCRQVIDTKAAVLTTNAQADQTFGRFASVSGLNLRSIVCVPFRIKSEIFGTVYLDASEVGAFAERDVELLEAFSDQAALAIENARLLHHARQRERIEQELKIASQIQRKLLPREVPNVPGIQLYGWMHPAKSVGGDYYDYVPSPDGKSLFIGIGDVSGKGVPAGLVMASLRSALRSLVQRGVRSTREIVELLNKLLVADLDQEMFCSFVLIRYDHEPGTFHYTGAGHETMLIWRDLRQAIEIKKTGGMVLGFVEGERNRYEEQTLDLAPGDGLVLYTDGVTDVRDAQGAMLHLEGLVELANLHGGRTPEQALHGILDAVLEFKGRELQRDDITLLVLKRGGPGPAERPEEETVRRAPRRAKR